MKTTFASDIKWSGKGVLSTAYINEKEGLSDAPQNLGGTDVAPNPVAYILAAVGGWISVLVITFAEKVSVELVDLDVQVEGELKPDGFLGINPDVRPGYEEIRYAVNITSPSPPENIQALLAHVDQVCPVKDTLLGTTVKSTQTKHV